MYVRNQWYVIAEPDEVSDGKFCTRMVMDENIVVFRTESGKLTALEDRCPHRCAPLSLGRVEGESIKCGYHGATFDGNGQCVSVPGQDTLPPAQYRVKSYPVVEKYGYIWIWMGSPELADKDVGFPEGFYMSDPDHPDWDGVYDRFLSFPCNYQLINDNLFDLSHAETVHPETLGAAETTRVFRSQAKKAPKPGMSGEIDEGVTYQINDNDIGIQVRIFDKQAGPLFHQALGNMQGKDTYEGNVDFLMNVDWWMPSFFSFAPTTKPAGQTSGPAMSFVNLNALTPETQYSTHYFFKTCQSQAPDNKELTNRYAGAVSFAFNQDKKIITEQQKILGKNDVMDKKQMSFSSDMIQMQARKKISRLIEAE